MRTTLAPVLLLLLTAGPAFAHGGMYRGAASSVPPGFREPGDLTMPPPPPPSEAPPSASGATPTAPTTVPAVPTAGAFDLSHWSFWFFIHREEVIGAPPRKVLSEDELERLRASLRWAMDPRNANHQDVGAAAWIAYARAARTPEHVDVLLDAARNPGRTSSISREGTAIALGLLRRSDPVSQFVPAVIGKVKTLLLDMVADTDRPTRERGFAALALGLLGDQPTSPEQEAQTTARMFELLGASGKEVGTGLLLALGLQPPKSVASAQLVSLRELAGKGTLRGAAMDPALRAQALLTLGRLGGKEEATLLLRLLAQASGKAEIPVQRSAALACGAFGRTLPFAEQIKLVRDALKRLKRIKDATTAAFLVEGLVRLALDAPPPLVKKTKLDQELAQLAGRKGGLPEDPRPTVGGHALLGLARIAGRLAQESPSNDVTQVLRRISAAAPDRKTTNLDKRSRSLLLLCAGLSRGHFLAYGAAEALAEPSDGYSAQDGPSWAALAKALDAERHPAWLKQTLEVATKPDDTTYLRSEEGRIVLYLALGRSGDTEARPFLLERFSEEKPQYGSGAVACALGAIGGPAVMDALIAVLKDAKQQDLHRAHACAALGLMADPEGGSSLSLLTRDVNHRSCTDLLNELLSLL